MSFDGVDDYVQSTFSPSISSEVSISFWIKPTGEQKGYIGALSWADTPTSAWSSLFLLFRRETPNSLSVAINDGYRVNATVADNEWSHIVLTHSSSDDQWLLYKNGEPSGSYLGGIAQARRFIFIGSGFNRTFNGAIDEVRIYDRTLSQAEVDSLYTNTSSVHDTNPPTIPLNLLVTAVSPTQIDLNWDTATDDVGVIGYRIYRDGVQVGTTPGTSYSDSGLTASTQYSYTVSAYDAAGNESGQSAGVVASTLQPSLNATITLDPSTRHQTMKGWEAPGWIDQFDDNDTRYRIDHAHLWSAEAADIAVNTFGINRVRLETHSGQENTTDYFAQYMSSQTTRSTWRNNVYNIVNDNDDPFTINPQGYQFAKVDYSIDLVINPLKARLEANGENLYVNLTYVAFSASNNGFSHYSDPEEYAEFMLALFQHIDSKYGWVPDGVEVILEPDLASGWSGTQVGNALVAAAKRLEANGYTPDFIAPSTMSMSRVSSYFDQVIGVKDASRYIKEISYHRYSGVSPTNLQNIVNRANQYSLDTSMLEWWNPNNTYHTLHEDIKSGNNSSWQNGVIAKVGSPENRLTLAVVDNSDPSNPQISINHGAKYIRQYTKFIRSGAQRIGATTDNGNFDPLAFINRDGGYVVVVNTESGGDFSIQGLAAGTYSIKYTTGSNNNPPTEYDIDLPNQVITSGEALTTYIPAAGVITIYSSPGSSDTTPPVVSGIQVSGLTPTGATVTFVTDEQTSVVVDYADDNYYSVNTAYNQTQSNPSYLTSHSLSLNNLNPSTTYHYRITVTDQASNTTVDVNRTFTTPGTDNVAPVLSNPTPPPLTILPVDTASTTLGVSTNEAAQCRYATTTNTDYRIMPNGFESTGSTIHMTTVTGLTNDTTYSIHVRCQDNAGNSNGSDYTITFSVAADNSSANQPPVLDAIGNIVVTEGETVAFSPTASDADGDTLTFSYSGWMTSSAYTTQVGDAGAHTVTVTVDDGNSGTDSQAVTVTVLESVTDTAPPVRSSASPVGSLPAGTPSTTISLTTDEPATCRYATTANTAYSMMASSFTTTGIQSHSTPITGLTDGNTYTYYVKCLDTSGNTNSNDFPITFTVTAPTAGNAFYVAPTGSDNNPGTLNLPFLTINKGLSLAQPGDTLFLREGNYDEQVNFPTAGDTTGRITLKAYNGEVVSITQTGRVMNVRQPNITVEDLILDGNWGAQDILKVYSTGDYLVLRNVEVKNTLRDAVDMSAPAGVLVENCKIHDAIYINNGVRVDAHGIVTGGVQDLTVRNTEIYYVSGDAIQLQYGGWNNVLIEDSRLWSAPLPTARGGANAGDNVGEDGVDTKNYGTDARAKLTINNTVVHGWGRGGNPLYGSSAGFNIKQNVDVTIDGVTAYDNNYAFRLRGPGSNGGAWVSLMNGIIYDSNIGVRYEDGIDNLRIYNTTFGNNITGLFQSAGGYGTGFEVKNNLFLSATLPVEAEGIDANLAVTAADFVGSNDYHLVSVSQAIDFGIDLSTSGVVVDRDGNTRPQGPYYDIGAYEYTGGTTPTNTPPVLATIADIEVTEGEVIVLDPSATDADGDSLTFTYAGWMTGNSYTTAAGDAGIHTVTVTVHDGNGGTDTQDVTVTVNALTDTTPPIVSNIQVTNITDTSATLTWSTNEPADSVVVYGDTVAYGSQASSNNLVTNHRLNLTGLSGSRVYHYAIQSRDAAGNVQVASDATFTTQALSTYQCSDGLDNDGDSLVDMSDPGCSSMTDNDETDPMAGLPAWVDTSSPLALNLHPRLFLVSDSYKNTNPTAYGITLSEMRNKLDTYYRTEFQRFIDVMDVEYSTAASGKARRDMVNDATNYAFLYMMDPTVLSRTPYSFTFAHTQAEYGAKAKEHLLEIASNVIGFSGLPYGGGWADVVHLVHRGHITVSMSMVYDWIYPTLTLPEKQTVADALIDSYNNRVQHFARRDVYPRTNNGTISIMQNGTLGALAMWGDDIDNSGSTYYADNLSTMLADVKYEWIERVFEWLNYIGEGSSNWAEGPIYNGTSYGDFARVFQLMGTPLNVDYYSGSSYFTERPLWMLFNIHPSKNSQNQTVWYHFDDDNPTKYFLGCRSCYYGLAPLYNSTGTLHKTNPDSASLAKWIKDDSGYTLSSNISSSHNDVRYYYLMYHFLWGDKMAQSKSPSQLNIPLSKKLGHGQFVMKTGFESPDDSQIVFWAPKYFEQQSHAHVDFASFTISKYGNLAVQRSIAKTFSGGNLHETARSMFYNTIGVYKPGEVHYGNYNLMGYRTNYDASAKHMTDPAYQDGGANHVGDVIAQDLEATNYDYINYDYSRAWDTTKVDYANREFVYLRSQGGIDDEYVIVLDRINAIDPSYTKYYLLHSSFIPSITADTIEITNNWSANSSHGKLFNKILLPTNYRINQINNWQDADGNIIHSAAGLTDEERNYRGSSTIQIESTTNLNHDTYLNVMQIGDSNTLTSMNQISRIDAGSMVGTKIDDPTAARIVLFSSDPQGARVGSVTYSVGGSMATQEKHLLLGMQPGIYDVYRDSMLIYSQQLVSPDGVLSFNSTAGSTYSVIRH